MPYGLIFFSHFQAAWVHAELLRLFSTVVVVELRVDTAVIAAAVLSYKLNVQKLYIRIFSFERTIFKTQILQTTINTNPVNQ